MDANRRSDTGADHALCAMKDGARLAQSLGAQRPENIGFFNDFSRPMEAISKAS
jgi:hypothetical protein